MAVVGLAEDVQLTWERRSLSNPVKPYGENTALRECSGESGARGCCCYALVQKLIHETWSRLNISNVAKTAAFANACDPEIRITRAHCSAASYPRSIMFPAQ